MGNSIGSFLSGFGQVVGKILHHPLDSLSGNSCNSICGSTWDFICYIENFCVARLLKLVGVTILVYFVLLFFYLLYNLGICQCICRSLCRIVRACLATYFSALHFCCTCLCYKLQKVKRERNRRKRDIENEYQLGESSAYQIHTQPKMYEHVISQSSRRRKYKHDHLRRSSRPSTHRAHSQIFGNSILLQRKKIMKKGRKLRTEIHHPER